MVYCVGYGMDTLHPYQDKKAMNGTNNHAFNPQPEEINKAMNGTNNHAFNPQPEEMNKPCRDDTDNDPEDDPDFDPWELPELTVHVTPWDELSFGGKLKRVLWDRIGMTVFLVTFLYLFICSLSFLSSAFQLLGGKAAGRVFRESELLSNPVAGVMTGILATVLVQSSSTSTSIVISMVGADIITVELGIPIVMGANIGTSVTNTIVSMGQITKRSDFRRAFAGATVHDMFNFMTVFVLLIIEVSTGYLYHLSNVIVNSFRLETYKEANKELLKVITKPLTKKIILINKDAIQAAAKGDTSMRVAEWCCDWNTQGNTLINATTNETKEVFFNETCSKKCEWFLFQQLAEDWSDSALGTLLLILSLMLLCTCLVCIVKILHYILQGKAAVIIRKYMNADFPGPCAYFTGYIAILVGAGVTILVQSSSIFTSSITPLVGIGVISLERMYPLTLGSNIGTTTTGLLAALAQSPSKLRDSLQLALCHLFFNITGILIFYPIPFMRFPIALSKFLGNETAKYRWYAIVYLIIMFFALPALVFGLSVAGWYVLLGVMAPFVTLCTFVGVIKCLQNKYPKILPSTLQNWKFLPLCLRSLKPVDNALKKLFFCNRCCNCVHHSDQSKPDSLTDNKDNFPVIVTRL